MLAFNHLFSATVALTSALTLVSAAPKPASAASALTSRASVCNGDASLCNRLYSNVTYIGAHNSYAVGTLAGATTGKNQEQDVTQQLDDGIRLLQVQAHRNANSTGASGIDLCHSSCELENGGSLESYLTKVNTWLAANPNDVVTLLIVNADDQSASTFGSAFSSTGISSRAYSPSSNVIAKSSWPTLSNLIDSGKNLVVFIDNSASESVPYILPHFSNTWENPYDQTSVPFNCSIDRINAGSSASNLMYLVNHYLDSTFNLFGTDVYVPNTAQLGTTNGVASIMTDANNCASMHDSWPTYVLTDFYDVGNGSVFQAAARMNGVQYVAKAIGNATNGGSSTGNGSGSGSGSRSSSGASKLGMAGSGALALVTLVAASTLV